MKRFPGMVPVTAPWGVAGVKHIDPGAPFFSYRGQTTRAVWCSRATEISKWMETRAAFPPRIGSRSFGRAPSRHLKTIPRRNTGRDGTCSARTHLLAASSQTREALIRTTVTTAKCGLRQNDCRITRPKMMCTRFFEDGHPKTCVAAIQDSEIQTGEVAIARTCPWRNVMKHKRSILRHQNAFGKEGITGHAKGSRPCI